MNRLFIDLYLDEDVNVLIAQVLRSQAFHVVTTVEAGNLQRPYPPNTDQGLRYL